MFKRCLWMLKGMVLFASCMIAQSNWTFVGPTSDNNTLANGFQTGQMTKIIADPNNNGHFFASSIYGGLWETINNGNLWNSIDMSSSGLNQCKAIAIKNNTELLVANFGGGTKLSGVGIPYSGIYSYPIRVSAYDFSNQSWFHYPFIPNISNYSINSVAVHPNNNSVIYAGTTMGFYRFDGINWTLVSPNTKIETIVFTGANECYISGSDQNGISIIQYSDDIGNNIFTTIATNIPGTSNSASITEICLGHNEIFCLTYARLTSNAEMRYLHKIDITNPAQTVSFLQSWSDGGSGPGRMAIKYDNTNNLVWMGAIKLQCFDISANLLYGSVKAGFESGNGLVHDDIHGLEISPNDELWVACDGGIVKGDLSALSNPLSIYFDRMNNKLNVALINGFSGSETSPNLFAIGCQDIIKTDIYDAAVQKNLFTHQTWENDGAMIDKFDENRMYLDNSSYNSLTHISTNKGATLGTFSGRYKPKSNPPFQADLQNPQAPIFDFGHQRTIQDPYRPKRIFELGQKGFPSICQFDESNNAFVLKTVFYSNTFSTISWQQMVFDISFSPQTKNSMHVITSSRYVPALSEYQPSGVYKYIGPDIDDSWYGNKEHWLGTPWASAMQWQDITPNYTNFSSIGGGAVNITTNEIGKVTFLKVETSSWNKDLIYAACNVNDIGPNRVIKVLKYDGTNWSDYSTGIPANEGVSSMELDYMSNDALYLTTETGSYYRDATMSRWIPFNNGFPMASSSQMEINYHENTVRAGTYGKGIWKSPLQCPAIASINHTSPFSSFIYEANTITSNAIATMNAGPTAYRATKSVTLNPGFSALGTTTSNQYFLSYIHGCNTSGSSYRQLNTTKNNEFWFSKIKSGDEIKENNLFSIFPNPATNEVTINYKLFEEQKGTIELRDLMGRIVKSINTVPHTYYLKLDLKDIANGTYVLNLNLGDDTLFTEKLIINKK
jgi:Secretion system C-terminal sorting domain